MKPPKGKATKIEYFFQFIEKGVFGTATLLAFASSLQRMSDPVAQFTETEFEQRQKVFDAEQSEYQNLRTQWGKDLQDILAKEHDLLLAAKTGAFFS